MGLLRVGGVLTLPDVAWRIDGRTLLALTPGMDQSMLNEVRSIIARGLGRGGADTWQEALNAASGATEHSLGRLSFFAHATCEACHGKRINMRLGQPCTTCMARGTTYERRTIRVRYAPAPEAASTTG